MKKAVKLATVFAKVAQVWAVTALMLASAGFITGAMAITSMLVSAVACVYLADMVASYRGSP